jgi:hypothetical protein
LSRCGARTTALLWGERSDTGIGARLAVLKVHAPKDGSVVHRLILRPSNGYIDYMPVRLSLVAALPKLRLLTREEAAHGLKVTVEELDEANSFALVTFADPDPEFPPSRPLMADSEALRERMPLKWREHYKHDRH